MSMKARCLKNCKELKKFAIQVYVLKICWAKFLLNRLMTYMRYV